MKAFSDEEMIFKILSKKKPKMGNFSDTILSEHSERMHLTQNVMPGRAVVCNKRFFRRTIIFFRKVLRRFFLKWYIEPICVRQTDFNLAVSNAFDELSNVISEQAREIELLRRRLDEGRDAG